MRACTPTAGPLLRCLLRVDVLCYCLPQTGIRSVRLLNRLGCCLERNRPRSLLASPSALPKRDAHAAHVVNMGSQRPEATQGAGKQARGRPGTCIALFASTEQRETPTVCLRDHQPLPHDTGQRSFHRRRLHLRWAQSLGHRQRCCCESGLNKRERIRCNSPHDRPHNGRQHARGTRGGSASWGGGGVAGTLTSYIRLVSC